MKRLAAPLVVLMLGAPLSACVSEAPRQTPVYKPRPVVRAPAQKPVQTPPPTAAQTPGGKRPQVKLYAPGVSDGPPDPDEIPPGLENTPDAVPRREPRSAGGNPSEYEAFGELYRILPSAEGYKENGRASWYGKKFNGRLTSSGERYDMYAMTAAHKTLPIPCYVRVTNNLNGKSVVVRVNDRGPFHSDRIIDLSYTAALKLGVLGKGTTDVTLEGLMPDDQTPMLAMASPLPGKAEPSPQQMSAVPAPAAPAQPGGPALWLQVASFTDQLNALNMRDQLRRQGLGNTDVREARNGTLHRVVIGPLANESEVQRMSAVLHTAGYAAFRLRD